MTVCFHYTSLQTFLAIAENSSIRLTDLKTSNDLLEGYYLVDSLADYLGHLGCPPHFIESCRQVVSRLVDIYTYYGFCLTTEGDDLGQWRAYGNQGRGVAIGFKVDKLLKVAKKHH